MKAASAKRYMGGQSSALVRSQIARRRWRSGLPLSTKRPLHLRFPPPHSRQQLYVLRDISPTSTFFSTNTNTLVQHRQSDTSYGVRNEWTAAAVGLPQEPRRLRQHHQPDREEAVEARVSVQCYLRWYGTCHSFNVSRPPADAHHAGQTGLGKSTLINTIFASHLVDSKGRLEPTEAIRSTTEIHPVTHIIEENGVRLRLNIVDTPGYGDLVNNDRCWDPIVKYIKDQHSAYLRKELTAQRERYIQDTRIHCCLYFIGPTGHALKPIDIVVLKKLSETVNVVPVIAKADSLTLEERQLFKDRIKEEFAFHNIRMYPYENEEYDNEESAMNSQIKVGSTQIVRTSPCANNTPVHHPLRSRRLRA